MSSPATEHTEESATASERQLPADGAAATEHSEESAQAAQITIESAFSGEQILGPLRIQRTQLTRSLLRQLQHIHYTEHQSAVLIRLTFDDRILDPSRPVMQYHAATEHMGGESEHKVVLKVIAEPLLHSRALVGSLR